LSAKVAASAISSFDNRINTLQQEIKETRGLLTRKYFPIDRSKPAIDVLPSRSLRAMIITIMTVVITSDCNIEIEWRWDGGQGAELCPRCFRPGSGMILALTLEGCLPYPWLTVGSRYPPRLAQRSGHIGRFLAARGRSTLPPTAHQ
jgi:hypothetical protein